MPYSRKGCANPWIEQKVQGKDWLEHKAIVTQFNRNTLKQMRVLLLSCVTIAL